jgi:hypothetical protein
MKLTQLITINAILAIAFGIAFGIYGPIMMAFFNVPETPGGTVDLYWLVVSFARMYGAALFGFGFLLWAVRGLVAQPTMSSVSRRGIIFSLLLANAMGAFVAIVQQSAFWLSGAGWVTVGVYLLLLAGYIYFLVKQNAGISSA